MKLKDRISAFMGKSEDNANIGEKSAGLSQFVMQQMGGMYQSVSISPALSLILWEMSDAIYTAVDYIATPFSQMHYSLYDKKTKEYITGADEHPLLYLLDNPGYLMDSTELMYSIMTSFLTCGAGYPKAIGNVKYEPNELRQVYPNKVNLIPDHNNYIQGITFSDNEDSNYYVRQMIPKRKTAVYQAVNGMAETIQILKAKTRTGIQGTSPLSRVVHQVYSKYYGNQHNSSILKNGTRAGGVWMPGTDMNQNQYEAFINEIKTNFRGPQNAGRDVVAPVAVKYENFMLTPQDMDFFNLIDQSEKDIFKVYKIPMPLVSEKTMTMANMENSIMALFDLSVIPNSYIVLKRLGDFLLPRYKDGDRFELTFDEKTLPALRFRMMETAKKMREIQAYTDDEIRATTGHGDRPDGMGNMTFKQTTWMPDNLDTEEDDLTGDDLEDDDEI